MKKIKLFLLIIFAAFAVTNIPAQSLPADQGFINDFIGVMSQQEKQEAENLANDVKNATGAEMAIIVVPTYEPYGSIDEFAVALFNSWGIGESGKDNGVLLVLAMNEREVRIEVGYGLEGAIPDAAAGRILDNAVLPAFREGSFGRGLVLGFHAIAERIAIEYGIDPAQMNITALPPQDFVSDADMRRYELYVFCGWFFLLVFFFGGLYRNVIYGLYWLICKISGKPPQKFSDTKWYKWPPRGGSSLGRYRGGSSFGGGGSFRGGGFGGGRSGGGGASRRF